MGNGGFSRGRKACKPDKTTFVPVADNTLLAGYISIMPDNMIVFLGHEFLFYNIVFKKSITKLGIFTLNNITAF